MSKDIPNRKKTIRERGTYASHSEESTLASYLSSLFLVLSVPSFILAAYAGHWAGLYSEIAIIPVFGGLLVAAIAAVFALMHVFTSGR